MSDHGMDPLDGRACDSLAGRGASCLLRPAVGPSHSRHADAHAGRMAHARQSLCLLREVMCHYPPVLTPAAIPGHSGQSGAQHGVIDDLLNGEYRDARSELDKNTVQQIYTFFSGPLWHLPPPKPHFFSCGAPCWSQKVNTLNIKYTFHI